MHAPRAQLAAKRMHSSGARAQCELLAGGRPRARLSVRLVRSGCSLVGSPNAGQVAAGAAAAVVEQATALISSIGTERRARRRGIFLE